MYIECKSCGEHVPAEHVNIDNMLAKCLDCDAVFDISDLVRPKDEDAAAARAAPGQQRRRARVPMPGGIKVTRSSSSAGALAPEAPYRGAGQVPSRWLHITRRWFSSKHIFMLFFCIAWDSFLVFWYLMAGRSGNLMMIIFPIAHVAVGVGLTYATLAGLLNKTHVRVTNQELSIKHGPVPWKGNQVIPTRYLAQLYVQRKFGSSRQGGSTESFTLSALLRSGRKLTLVKGLEEADQALFMEQEIEELLGIIDVAVGDEYQP